MVTSRTGEGLINDEWKTVQRVFARARLLQGAERETYLRRERLDDATRRTLNLLLAQNDRSQNFLGLHSTLAGTTVSHFDVGERLGEGGMGVIYDAFDRRLQRRVALKALPNWARGHSQFRERLLNEARHASAVSHPNIVTVHEIVDENGLLLIVMELFSGKTLDQVIPPDGLPWREALHYAAQIADALSTAQAAGILHGDLKPPNVMVSEGGHVKILDFGLAQVLSPAGKNNRKTTLTAPYGTKTYMAPELLASPGRRPNRRSEIFSFGLLLHEMLSGGHAFGPADRLAIVQAILEKPPRQLSAAIPISIQTIVFRCLEKKPSQRFASVSDVRSVVVESSPETVRYAAGPAIVRQSTTLDTACLPSLATVQTLIDQIRYENIAKSRHTLAELERWIDEDPPLAFRQIVSSGLRRLILTVPSDGHIIVSSVRDVRKRVFDILRKATSDDLYQFFGRQDFEHLDLYGFNFEATNLLGTSFGGAFLVECSFASSNLAGASFAGAYIRNVNFSGANMHGADFTDADWFNALELTPAQLTSVRQETLRPCPPDIAAMHSFLESHYAFPFTAWSAHVQEQLQATWKSYLAPKGLRWRMAGNHRP
jgi:serine/threonine protein kinase